MSHVISCLAVLIQLVASVSAHAAGAGPADWPQILGPQRDGRYLGPALAETWPDGRPPVLWTHDAGAGFSGPIVSGETLIFFHRLDDQDVVEALAADSGRAIWKFTYPATYRDRFGFNNGPRASPTAAAGRVFTYSADGRLHALDLRSGELLWAVDARRRFDADEGFFGFGSSPLVDGGRVIVEVGGEDDAGIVAFEAATGKVLWRATSDEASYASPIAATLGGTRRLLVWTREALVDLDPQTGAVGLTFKWRSRQGSSVNAATPLVFGDRVFLSASYNTGAVLLALERNRWRQVWSSDDVLSNHYATSVHLGGHLFGFHGRTEVRPDLRCVRLDDGEVVWSAADFGAGSMILTGETLVIVRENGEVVLAPAQRSGFEPRARAKILDPTVRAAPALAHGVLFARNERKLVAVDLRVRKADAM